TWTSTTTTTTPRHGDAWEPPLRNLWGHHPSLGNSETLGGTQTPVVETTESTPWERLGVPGYPPWEPMRTIGNRFGTVANFWNPWEAF
ncbi:hypothetical protein HPB47_020062, partial [Ixodes persulcatus]